MTSESPHLLIEQGIEKGRRIIIPVDGARIGRSSKNDIVIDDPKMSRHHCRIMHKQGIGLHVADLGSANHTLGNGSPIQEIDLKPGDGIESGDTLLRVSQPAGKPTFGQSFSSQLRTRSLNIFVPFCTDKLDVQASNSFTTFP